MPSGSPTDAEEPAAKLASPAKKHKHGEEPEAEARAAEPAAEPAALPTNATAPKKTAPIETTDAKQVAAAKRAAEGQCSAQSNLLACAAEASRLESACSCGSVDIDMVTIDPMSARCSNRSCRLPIHDKQRMAAELQAIDAVRALGVQRHELW